MWILKKICLYITASTFANLQERRLSNQDLPSCGSSQAVCLQSHRIACPASYLGERQLLFMLLFKIKKLKITWKGKMFIGELEYLVMSRTAFIYQAECATHLRQKGGKQGTRCLVEWSWARLPTEGDRLRLRPSTSNLLAGLRSHLLAARKLQVPA